MQNADNRPCETYDHFWSDAYVMATTADSTIVSTKKVQQCLRCGAVRSE